MTTPAPSVSEHSSDARTAPSTDVLVERVRAVENSIAALDRIVNERIDAEAEKVALALAGADKAVLKAEGATDKRFDSVNAFRSQLADQTKSFVTKPEFDTVVRANGLEGERVRALAAAALPRVEFGAVQIASEKRLASLELSRSAVEGKSAGITPIWTMALALGGALALFLIERAVIR